MPAYPGGAPCGVHFLFAPDAHCGVAAWVDRQKQLPAASLSSRTSAGNQSRPASSPISWEPGVRSWKLPFKSKPREPLNETGLYDYAMKLGAGRFGIFDTFEDEEGRKAHLTGAIAKALFAKADELLADPPRVDPLEIIAVKAPRA